MSNAPAPVFDLLIVGGGISGLIQLHYARQAGLRVCLLERGARVGGLWRDLPAWQDIQIRPVDWTVGDLPISGPMQGDILANIESWVDRFGLAADMRLNHAVTRAAHEDGAWQVDTPQGRFSAHHLVAATGVHNRPVVPEVQRSEPRVREWHSSELRDPTLLRDQRVWVVGGGASAFDLLELCFAHGARQVMWAYRGVRWFTPTKLPKAVAGSFRPYARMQAQGLPIEQQNALIDADLRGRYARWGLQDIQPDRPIDMRRDQIIPGRAGMLAHFDQIERHPYAVRAIAGHAVELDDGTTRQADVVLWGTGYATDLRYFANPQIAAIRSEPELSARCGCLFRSLDEPNLYFTGIGLEGAGATSFAFAITARSIVSHIQGRARLDMARAPHKLNHLDMIGHLAARDPGSFDAEGGWAHYRDLTLGLAEEAAFPLPPPHAAGS